MSCESAEQADSAMRMYYDEYLASGVAACRSDLGAVMRYSQCAMAGQFARLLANSAD